LALNLPKKGRIADKPLIKRVWDAEGKLEWDAKLFQRTASILQQSFAEGIEQQKAELRVGVAYGIDNPMLLTAFELNLFHFSAGKTSVQLQELNKLFRKAKSFREFEVAALQLTKTFNRQWLETEYNTANLIGKASATYHRLMGRTDLFPYWEYKTIGDDKVRDEHAAMDGIILPANHKFWKIIFPPNDWNCRCYLVPRQAAEVADIDFKKMEERVEAYMRTKAFERAKNQGFGVNRADLGEVFTAEQQYPKVLTEAYKKFNALNHENYKLATAEDLSSKAKEEAPTYEGTEEEFYAGLDLINDRRVIEDYNQRQHHVSSMSKVRLALTLALEQALQSPDEVWLNAAELADQPNRLVYIRYFNGSTLVAVGTLKGKVRKLNKWFSLKNAADVEAYRKGLLIK
tara:strand:- start:11845 stop:13050 length:1206 start_codon:yes stop_codon:yes gene_type:complete